MPTEKDKVVDDEVPVDAFLDTLGTHVPDVSTAPEPIKDEEKLQRKPITDKEC